MSREKIIHLNCGDTYDLTWLIIAVMHLKQLQVKLKTDSNPLPMWYQCSAELSSHLRAGYYFSGFNFTTASVVCITANVSHVFTCFSTVQINDLSHIYLHKFLYVVIPQKLCYFNTWSVFANWCCNVPHSFAHERYSLCLCHSVMSKRHKIADYFNLDKLSLAQWK